ncbi:hypothetical protein [Vibrio fluvialis]|uniref:hypothetical protein n=1 Tax=Vibrio fluvialis TaxID=676 RepID=UPI000B083DF6|nr:hypothetical protein [Vibrio fluvialis]
MLKAVECGVPAYLSAMSIRERMVQEFVIECSEEGRTSANLGTSLQPSEVQTA